MNSKKGSVLLIVLIIITTALAIAMSLSEKNTESYVKTVNLKNLLQANIIATTAASSVAQIIKEDNNKSDSLEDAWAYPFSYNQDNIFVEIKVTPLNSKININNLYDGEEKVIKRVVDSFEKIAEDNDISLTNLHLIADYIDNNTTPMAYGNENDDINYFGRTLTVKNKPLDTFFETFIILDNTSYNKLNKIFTANNGEKKININFASKEVLQYYLPELDTYIDDIIKYRESNVYDDVSEIRKATNIPNDVYQSLVEFISVKSDDFYLRINIDISGKLFYYHSLINRKDGVKLFFKGLNENYF
ncbi:general secretion pathway protein GspK [Deferribacterales bacterium Es71-Z0220]|uniref:general secretion pathway protein GspK n=1 Tax=Deferrivibrio essentukiensis TaxID=2880922 RepID=UPI001F6136CF|nr:hypothetical protein [Deferribacteraceae bacterium]MCB4205580.1 general secretion pathway protein GspK [Deferrivibrio essentukiensis]